MIDVEGKFRFRHFLFMSKCIIGSSPGLRIPCLVLAAMAWWGTTNAGGQDPAPPASLEDLTTLYNARDYFTLRERLKTLPDEDSPAVRFLRAATRTAFNRPAESNEIIAPLLELETLDASLTGRLLSLQFRNLLRLHEYHAARLTAQTILGRARLKPNGDAPADVRNLLGMLRLLQNVPPQINHFHGDTNITMFKGRVPLLIHDQDRLYRFDPLANHSMMSRAEAESLGLKILEAGIEIATVSDRIIKADIAIAQALRIGNVEYRNVVFLVFSNEMRSVGDGKPLDGVIGFPVIEMMGEIRFLPDNVLEIPAKAPRRRQGNLALDGLNLLVRVDYRDDWLVGRFNPRIEKTRGFEPFYQRFKSRIEAKGVPGEIEIQGADGPRPLKIYTLPTFSFTLAGEKVMIENVDVLTQPVTSLDENYLMFSLGLDALKQFEGYIINFRDMALIPD